MYTGFVTFIFVFFVVIGLPVKGQKPDNLDANSESRARDILKKAQINIYKTANTQKITSLFFSVSGKSSTQTTTFIAGDKPRVNETSATIKDKYSVQSPSLARINREYNTSAAGLNVGSVVTTITNGVLVQHKADAFMNGQKVRSNLPDTGKKPTLTQAEVRWELQTELLPLLLKDIAGSPVRFSYIGKAEAEGQTAFVLQLQSENAPDKTGQSTVRYFFDAKTFFLLMVTNKYSTDKLDRIETSYFSDHKIMSGLLIPFKIKRESKSISKEPIEVLGRLITRSEQHELKNWTVDEFEINRKFPIKIFEIKK